MVARRSCFPSPSLSSLGTGLAHNWYILIAFRFLGGVAIGAASVVTPIYIAEVSPARFGGRLVAMNQLNIVLGILIAFLSNYVIAQALPPETAWRWMFPVVASAVGGWVFAFFGAMMLLQFIWAWKMMPETNGVALEDMDLRGTAA